MEEQLALSDDDDEEKGEEGKDDHDDDEEEEVDSDDDWSPEDVDFVPEDLTDLKMRIKVSGGIPRFLHFYWHEYHGRLNNNVPGDWNGEGQKRRETNERPESRGSRR